MAYKKGRHGKKNAQMWAKYGKDRLGNDSRKMRQADIALYGKENLAFI